MKQRRSVFHSVAVEAMIVLLASILSLWLSGMLDIKLCFIPIVLVVIYAMLKFLYHTGVSKAELYSSKRESEDAESSSHSFSGNDGGQDTIKDDDLKKRMESFHHEYQFEKQLYLQQKEKNDDLKMVAVLKYTRNTFNRLGFDETETFQICECVRYLVTTRQVLRQTVHIKKRSTVTQIALKNFAWNISFQYNISGDTTARFVMVTFNEWFANTSFDTIRKNLRTTTGKHSIEIDEHIA